MAWVWTTEKPANHKISLAVGAVVVDSDPCALTLADPFPGEERWNTIGSAGGIATFFVVHTIPEGDE